MDWTKIKTHLAWVTIAPLVVSGWGLIGSAVYFVDWVEFAREVVTEENLQAYQQLIVKVDYLLEAVDELQECD